MFVAQKVSKQEAENIFSSQRRFFFSISRKNRTVPDRIELIHLPFYVFEVDVESEGQRQKVSLSVDGLVGNAVFFTKDDIDIENMESFSSCDFILSPSKAEDVILNEYKRLLLEIGLRTRKCSTAEDISGGKKIFYPFWVGYFKKRKGYDFKALDAVSGEIQGVKMRKVFLRALREM